MCGLWIGRVRVVAWAILSSPDARGRSGGVAASPYSAPFWLLLACDILPDVYAWTLWQADEGDN